MRKLTIPALLMFLTLATATVWGAGNRVTFMVPVKNINGALDNSKIRVICTIFAKNKKIYGNKIKFRWRSEKSRIVSVTVKNKRNIFAKGDRYKCWLRKRKDRRRWNTIGDKLQGVL